MVRSWTLVRSALTSQIPPRSKSRIVPLLTVTSSKPPLLSMPTCPGLPGMISPLMVWPFRSTVMPSAPMTSPFPPQSSRSLVSVVS
jgi:hypothetical protein